MMNIEDYALDVGKTVEEIEALCDKIGIEYNKRLKWIKN